MQCLGDFYTTFSRVPHVSILDPVLFNMFLNDLYLSLQYSDIHNFSDDNTITAICKHINDFLHTSKKEVEQAIDWFNNNHATANPEKFQTIVLSKADRSRKLNI